MDILIRIIYSRYFDLIGSVCRNEKKKRNNSVSYVKVMATEKLVDLEVILSIYFKQEYLEGLEGFKLILFLWKKWPLSFSHFFCHIFVSKVLTFLLFFAFVK